MTDFFDFLLSYNSLRDAAWFAMGGLAWELARRKWVKRCKRKLNRQVTEAIEETHTIKELLACGQREMEIARDGQTLPCSICKAGPTEPCDGELHGCEGGI
jgi:hypothetical protein